MSPRRCARATHLAPRENAPDTDRRSLARIPRDVQRRGASSTGVPYRVPRRLGLDPKRTCPALPRAFSSFGLGARSTSCASKTRTSSWPPPGNPSGLSRIADAWHGWPCVLRMRRVSDEWRPSEGGWGLVDVRSGGHVDPKATPSRGQVEMTDWELLDFAVQVVRTHVTESLGRPIMSWKRGPRSAPVRVVRRRLRPASLGGGPCGPPSRPSSGASR